MHPSHIAAVAQIWHEGWHDGHAAVVPEALTRLRVLSSFQHRSAEQVPNTLVALGQSGEVLGFCMVKDDEIYQMYLGPAARSTGLAQTVLSAGEARIGAAGHSTAWLHCAIGNARAAAFYEKCGWHNARVEIGQLDTSQGKFPLELWRFEKGLGS